VNEDATRLETLEERDMIWWQYYLQQFANDQKRRAVVERVERAMQDAFPEHAEAETGGGGVLQENT
jgi:hypothetical protein